MSIKVMDAVWDGFPRGGPDLLALLCLADWCDDLGRCFPSINSISRKLRISRSQAQRVVHRLILDGWVAVIGGHDGGAPGATRRYQLNVRRLNEEKASRLAQEEASETGSESATGSKNATRRKSARDGSQICAKRGRKNATQPVSEPSLNRQEEASAAAPALRRSRGGGRYVVTATGIHHCPTDQRDASALETISSYPHELVAAAIQAAAAAEPGGRAFPSAVLKTLRNNGGQVNGSGEPARDYLRRRMQEIERETTVIDI